MNGSTLRRAPLLGVAGLVVIIDQASKQLASSSSPMDALFHCCLACLLVHNTGAFSLF